MQGLRQKLAGTDFRGTKARKSIKLLPAFPAETYASYIFADDRPEVVGFDHSGHGRHVDTSTATFLVNRLQLGLGISKKIVYPFTGDNLLSSGAVGEFTIAAFIRSGSSAFVAGCLFGTETSFGLFQNTIDNGKVIIQNGTTQIAATLNVNALDPARADRFEMLAVTASPTERIVYRCFTNAEGVPVMTQSLASTATATMAGARAMQSGINPQGSNYAPTFEMAGISFFDRKLTGVEMAAAFLDERRFLSIYGITV